MADVTPTYGIYKAIDGLRTLLANNTWFRTWVGAANPTAALAFIFPGVEYPASDPAAKQFVVLTHGGFKAGLRSSGTTPFTSGHVTLIMHGWTSTAYVNDDLNSWAEMWETVSAMIFAIMAGGSGQRYFHDVEVVQVFFEAKAAGAVGKKYQRWYAELSVFFGPQGL